MIQLTLTLKMTTAQVFIIQRHNELRDLKAQVLNLVCHDVEIEPFLQEITGESLARGANTAPDARLDIHAWGFWSRQRSTFFDVRVCHQNAKSYKDLTPQQIYRQHENEKKGIYASRVMEVEQATFTPLVFTITGGVAPECQVYHKRLAELLSAKKRRGLLDYDVLDKNQNLVCHSENIPPMLKGIALNEESKCQPKRDGL